MGSLRTLLLATDFRDGSHAALGWASAICRAHRARLVLFHAIPGHSAPTEARIPTPAPSHQALREAFITRLGLQAELLSVDDKQILVETRPETSGAAILDAARRCRADLIVVASSRLQGAARWLSDSVSAEVFDNADRPVLVVHAEDAGVHGPICNLLCVSNIGGPPKALVALARHLLPSQELRVVVLRVAEDGVAADAARLLASDLPPTMDDVRFETLVVEGSLRKVIPERAIVEGADLIAMQVGRASPLLDLFRVSDAEAAAVRAPCPLLFWPSDDSR